MSERSSLVRNGRCLCGAVTYDVVGPPVVVARCHCIDCQRGSGAGHSTGAMFPIDRFRLAGVMHSLTGSPPKVSDIGFG
ncbi:MAG: hypothetical protein C0511_12355 [Hyphomicrobium sp.]|nr:hypothetical protein [Hyphomicrobium sp.]